MRYFDVAYSLWVGFREGNRPFPTNAWLIDVSIRTSMNTGYLRLLK